MVVKLALDHPSSGVALPGMAMTGQNCSHPMIALQMIRRNIFAC